MSPTSASRTRRPRRVGRGRADPAISPDGRHLYLDLERLPCLFVPRPVTRVPVALGEPFTFGEREVAAEPPGGASLERDVGGDGAVYWVALPDARSHVLVVNWAQEVDSLVRAASGGTE